MSLGLDLLNQIVNVHWSGAAFSFAGEVNREVVTPAGEDGGLEQSVLHFTWLGGTSSDGKEWKAKKSEAGLGLFCCVRGKVGNNSIAVAAGDVVAGPYDFGPGYAIHYGRVPAGGVSYDDGLTWSNAGIPKQEHILKPPNPDTGAGADSASGSCNAVAYHPGTQTFYVGGSVIFRVGADIYWEDRMYRSSGIRFSQVYSERRELSAPFKGFQWPAVEITEEFKPEDRLCVADMTMTTKPGPDVLFVVSFGPNQRAEYVTTEEEKSYVTVKAEGKGATLGGTDIKPPMAIVNSICGGVQHIVAVGWKDEDKRIGPVTFVSNDDGNTWKAVLSELTNTAPGPGDKDRGGNSGSCSFCK
jgi:hypothetical protein